MDRDVARSIGMLLPIMATIGATASFQVGAAFAKNLFPAIGPQGAATLRIGLGAILLIAIARPWRAWPLKAPVLPVIGLGLAMAGAILMFYQAMNRLPLGVAMALQFLGPLSIAVFGSRRAIDLVWAALAAAGVWTLVGVDTTVRLDPVGIAWSLGAATCWAGYILCGRVASTSLGASTAAIATGIAAIVMLPVGVQHAGLSLFSPALIPMALLVALFSTAIPFSLEFYAMPRMPARTFAVFMSFEPAFGVLSGLVILHEQLTEPQIAGVAVVIVAAAGAAWSSARKKPSAPPDIGDAPPT